MRVHMETFIHLEPQLHNATLARRNILLLCYITHMPFRLCRSIEATDLQPKSPSHQSRKHPARAHHCPPAAGAPEAIVFLMCASISSFAPRPAVSSTTTPFRST